MELKGGGGNTGKNTKKKGKSHLHCRPLVVLDLGQYCSFNWLRLKF